MADETFARVRTKALGVEHGDHRYPPGKGAPPYCSTLRNNLTALSQHYNLYFVASAEYIRVFQPDYRSQEIHASPTMIIPPMLKNPDAFGFIHSSPSSTINHLMTGDLGHDEILLIARDDGNISAYFTSQILDVIVRFQFAERVPFPKNISSNGIRPFFSEWVRWSAWGLAIHKYARMIAVSTNERVVNVFAFALVGDQCRHASDSARNSAELDLADQAWAPMPDAIPDEIVRIPARTHNHLIRLRGKNTDNIPSVSFLNSEDDYEGRWLVATDIQGFMHVFDIWKGVQVLGYSLETPLMDPTTHEQAGTEQRGWGVLALDPTWFKPKANMTAACGGNSTYRTMHDIWDITNNVRMLPDAPHSIIYATVNPSRERRNIEYREDNILSFDSMPLPGLYSQASGEASMSDVYAASSDDDPIPELVSPNDNDYGETVESEASEESEEEDYEDDGVPLPSSRMIDMATVIERAQREAEIEDAQRQRGWAEGLRAGLPFSILHFSETDVRLLNQGVIATVCAHPISLDYEFSPGRPRQLVYFERINMIQLIPEHGIVVAASQAGLAMVISLTSIRGRRSFRIDAVLPTEEQEKKLNPRTRPETPLLGIAVSPIQGHEIPLDDIRPIGVRQRRRRSHSDSTFDSDSSNNSSSNGPVFSPPDSPNALKSPTTSNPTPNRHFAPSSASSSSSSYNSSSIRPTVQQQVERFYSRDPSFNKEQYRIHRQPVESESWHWAGDSSRRYRLMMYYVDHTVLSYEIEVPDSEGKGRA